MMRHPIPIVAFLLGLLAGCGGISFDVGQDLAQQTVPGSPLGGLLPSFIPSPIPLTIDIQSETAKMGTGPATHAYVKSLALTATPHSMPSGTFDFLSEVHIYVAQRGGGSLPKVEVANLNPVPKGQTSITFTIVPNVDLLPYVNAGAEISSTASGTQPSKDFTFDGHIEVTIKI